MSGLIDVMTNYWMWMLLVLFIIIFTYIGYYVDKKGYLNKNKKEKNNDELVDIDELGKQKSEIVDKDKNIEEDLSSSFDVMPEVKQEEIQNDIPEELFAPFGDQVFEKKSNEVSKDTSDNYKVSEEKTNDVSEVVSDNYNNEFSNIDEIKNNAKDIKSSNNKKDVTELMKGEEQIDLSFDVEGSSDSIKTENIFADSKGKDKKKKKEEAVDEMWKF